ncbi:PP2C family protein-serine/threonine phosphatase [Streptomyces sp. CA-111067]|uniref:PP2C family protein-serine/threonine phosphatase n=1 Tax=Streptomyces sp. CA-111067 TaxID=3240046 RepID=UPI003D999EE6
MTWPARTSARGGCELLATSLATEQDVFALRRRAKALAEAVGIDARGQVRLATALSELGRDLLRPGDAVAVVFTLHQTPAALEVALSWPDDRAPSGESLTAVTHLLPQTRHHPSSAHGADPARQGQEPGRGPGGRIEITHPLPATVSDPLRIREAVRGEIPATAIDDLRAQTRDLLAALQEAHAQRDELERLNQELTETNTGVMALYAELTVEHNDVVERFTEEHELALTLQRTFLPADLPAVPGVELAVRYLPAAVTAEIGGDFYEAVPTRHGLLLAVGDVVGHSLQAAMVMGELRHALRAYAAQGHPPNILLEHLDNLMRLHHPGWTATLCIILVEPGNQSIQVANAGHLPPLLVTTERAARYLDRHGPLLGLNLPHPAATPYETAPGSHLLMITDGLIETRGTDLADRLDLLRDAIATGPTGPGALCDSLIETFGKHPEDDIVVLGVLLNPEPPTS